MRVTFEDQVAACPARPQFHGRRHYHRTARRADRLWSRSARTHPVTLDGPTSSCSGTGYALVVTVRDGTGAVLYQQATPFLAQDNLYTSVGAIKVGAARPTGLAFSGFFRSRSDVRGTGLPRSSRTTEPGACSVPVEGDLYPND